MLKPLDGITIAILVANGFEEPEMVEPRAALDAAGAKTVLISPEANTVRASKSIEWSKSYPIDQALKEANPANYDALLLPGGIINPDLLRMHPEAIEFIKKIAAAGKPIAAICHGPWTLINAQLVKGKTMTSWPSLRVDLENAGATWVDKEVVVDGMLVTSRRPADIPAFNKELITLLANTKK
ncbi:MAG: type 1 glutamine amidotransferase domain-containing protein [Candidatus Babeliales bacterium]